MQSTVNEEEIWKPVYGFEGLYKVSNFGRVKSLPRWVDRGFRGIPKTKNLLTKERILKPSTCAGYLKLTLVKDGKYYYQLVHRLVMAAFDGPSDLQVDHKDEDKQNNRYSNLRYCTCRQNQTFYTSKRSSLSQSKYTGVHYNIEHKRWQATISIKGKRKTIGYFDTQLEAHNAYEAKRIEVDGIMA